MPRTREQIEQAVAEFDQWQQTLDPDDPNVTVRNAEDLRAIGLAQAAAASAEQVLDATVAAARANGRSWPRIASVLGMSRQAAQKRFDRPALPRQGRL